MAFAHNNKYYTVAMMLLKSLRWYFDAKLCHKRNPSTISADIDLIMNMESKLSISRTKDLTRFPCEQQGNAEACILKAW